MSKVALWYKAAVSGILATMKLFGRNSGGFTVVELTVVIAVIGIMMAIGVRSYNSYVEDTRVATMKKDMQEIKLAIDKYYAKNGEYPMSSRGSGVWSRRTADGDTFITGIIPEHITTIGDVTFGDKSDTWANTYIYKSDGKDYKLIRLAESGKSLPDFEIKSIEPELRDPARWESPSSPLYRAWGYWSPGGKNAM